MSWFGFGGAAAELDISVEETGRQVWGRDEANAIEKQTLFTGNEPVRGQLILTLPKGSKKLEHLGIKIELIGQIEYTFDRGNPYEFTSSVRELEPPGDLLDSKTYSFEFLNFDKRYETYNGQNVRLRYFLRAKITRQYAGSLMKCRDLAVQNVVAEPEASSSIKMEVGIEDCLHIEFEYNKNKYHTQDVVIGKIYFLLVRIKIKHMEVVVIRRESCGAPQGANTFNESENLAKYEIMDGAPVRGESIPIRLFLSPYDLSPTMKSIENKFSVKYYLNLVLVDDEDRRYFKQQEITLWRKMLRPLKPDDEAPTPPAAAPPAK